MRGEREDIRCGTNPHGGRHQGRLDNDVEMTLLLHKETRRGKSGKEGLRDPDRASL